MDSQRSQSHQRSTNKVCDFRNPDAGWWQRAGLLGRTVHSIWNHCINHWNFTAVDRDRWLVGIQGICPERQSHRRLVAWPGWSRLACEPFRIFSRSDESLGRHRAVVRVLLLGVGIVSFQVTDDAEVDVAVRRVTDVDRWRCDAADLVWAW